MCRLYISAKSPLLFRLTFRVVFKWKKSGPDSGFTMPELGSARRQKRKNVKKRIAEDILVLKPRKWKQKGPEQYDALLSTKFWWTYVKSVTLSGLFFDHFAWITWWTYGHHCCSRCWKHQMCHIILVNICESFTLSGLFCTNHVFNLGGHMCRL